jgi:hypothetical protein
MHGRRRINTAMPPLDFAMANGDGIGRRAVIDDGSEAFVVRAGPWRSYKPGDEITLTLQGLDTVVATGVYDETQDERCVCLRLPLASFKSRVDGDYVAMLELRRGGALVSSARRDVTIKLSTPGEPPVKTSLPYGSSDLCAATVEGEVYAGASVAHVVVPPYSHMSPGDRITVAWGRRFIAFPPVTMDQVGLPLVTAVDDPLRDCNGMQELRLTWQVHDTVGNWSGWAPPSYIQLPIVTADAPTPWMENTVDDGGAVYDIRALKMPKAFARAEGHTALGTERMTLHWEGITGQGKVEDWISRPMAVRRDGATIDFDMPTWLLRNVVGGCGYIHYQIHRHPAPPRRSAKRIIEVPGEPTALPAPSISQAVGAVLDPYLARGGASVHVPAWPGVGTADECHLVWLGTTASGQSTVYRDVATGREANPSGALIFPVPAREVGRLDKGLLKVCYRVRTFADVEYPDGARRECVHTLDSDWLDLRVQLTQDVPRMVTDDLNGLHYHAFDYLERPSLTFRAVQGVWCVRGGRDGIAPFHGGTFIACPEDSAILHVDFEMPCESVRFGYGASGPGGAGSLLRVDALNTKDEIIGESVFTVPTTGLPGLWVQLKAEDFGERIASIVVRKETSGLFRRVTAQLDNFTLTW